MCRHGAEEVDPSEQGSSSGRGATAFQGRAYRLGNSAETPSEVSGSSKTEKSDRQVSAV